MVCSPLPTLHPASSDIRAEFLSLLPLTILVPAFDDWVAARFLVDRIDSVFSEHALMGQTISVDDGSLEPVPEDFPQLRPHNIQPIQSVELRSIYVGRVRTVFIRHD
jgi:hypothetical protein